MTKPEQMKKLNEWLNAMTDRMIDNIIANIEGIQPAIFDGYSPTCNPAQAYPLILRERISIRMDRIQKYGCRAYILNHLGSIEHFSDHIDPLIAAMRVFVINYFDWHPKERSLFLLLMEKMYVDPSQLKKSL